MKKILILMAKFGGGHESIAAGIKEAIEKYSGEDFKVAVEDGFPKIFTDYQAYGSFPFLADQGYKITNYEKISKILHTTITMLVGRYLKKLILKHSPDLIISNHPLLTAEVKSVLEKIKKKIKFAIYFADAIYPHHVWFSEKNADIYFAPTHECFDYALKNEISKEKMVYTGWILREKYYERLLPSIIYKKNLGFNSDKFLIVLSGGGEGVGNIFEIAKMLLENKFFKTHGQLVVVCGTNQKLLVKMQKIQRRYGDVLCSFGFIYNFSDYKKAADLIVSKSGPNDIFESILLEKTFFAHDYFWPHEIDNFKWIKTKNIGVAEKSFKNMVNKIISVMKKPELLNEKIENVRLIKKDHIDAPKILANEIEKLLSTPTLKLK